MGTTDTLPDRHLNQKLQGSKFPVKVNTSQLETIPSVCLSRTKGGQHGKTDAGLWRGVDNRSAHSREQRRKGKGREKELTVIVSGQLQSVTE